MPATLVRARNSWFVHLCSSSYHEPETVGRSCGWVSDLSLSRRRTSWTARRTGQAGSVKGSIESDGSGLLHIEALRPLSHTSEGRLGSWREEEEVRQRRNTLRSDSSGRASTARHQHPAGLTRRISCSAPGREQCTAPLGHE